MAVKTEKIQYNQLPRPTFRWMKVNHLELDPLKAQAAPAYTPEERHDGDAAVTFYEAIRCRTSAISRVPMRKNSKKH